MFQFSTKAAHGTALGMLILAIINMVKDTKLSSFHHVKIVYVHEWVLDSTKTWNLFKLKSSS